MFQRLFRESGGNIIVPFGLALPVLAVGMGFAVDYSGSVHKHAELQNAADAAALAGARELGSSFGEAPGKREDLAIAAAESFLVGKVPLAERNIAPSLDEASVLVELSFESPQYFGALMGQATQLISVSATATYLSERVSGCVIALGQSAPIGIELHGSPDISAPQCGVWSNAQSDRSIKTQGSANIRSERICAVGAVDASRGLSPEPESGCDPAPDPYAGRLPVVGAHCDFTEVVIDSKHPVTIQPGTYCGGLEIKGGAVTLDPGLYVVRDGPFAVTSHAEVTGVGVSILLAGAGASFDLQGSPSLTLTAMNSGPLAGIALAMADDGMAKTASMQGSPSLRLSGSIYMPGASFEMQGSPSLWLTGLRDKFVAHSIALQGSPSIKVDAENTAEAAADVASLRLIH